MLLFGKVEQQQHLEGKVEQQRKDKGQVQRCLDGGEAAAYLTGDGAEDAQAQEHGPWSRPCLEGKVEQQLDRMDEGQAQLCLD